MTEIDYVLDASAVLAYLRGEPGSHSVAAVLERSALGAVNYFEVLAKMVRDGYDPKEAAADVIGLGLVVVPFDEGLAREGADLASYGWTHGLSLGDRACLTLARHLGVPAVTADRRWEIPGLPVQVRFVR